MLECDIASSIDLPRPESQPNLQMLECDIASSINLPYYPTAVVRYRPQRTTYPTSWMLECDIASSTTPSQLTS